MNKIFESFLSKGYAYNFGNGPDVIRTEKDAEQKGLNCLALMHLLAKKIFDVDLPEFLKGWEMYCDNPYLDNVPPQSDSKTGDIFIFGRKQLPDYALRYLPRYDKEGKLANQIEGDRLIGQQYAGVHTAMHTGDFASSDDPLLIHANKMEGAVVIWPLSKFLGTEQYAVIHAIKRIKS